MSTAQPVDDIDGLFEFTRIFDNDPGSTLTVDTSQFPTSATVDEATTPRVRPIGMTYCFPVTVARRLDFLTPRTSLTSASTSRWT